MIEYRSVNTPEQQNQTRKQAIKRPKMFLPLPTRNILFSGILAICIMLAVWGLWQLQVPWYILPIPLILGIIPVGYNPNLSRYTGFGKYDAPKSDYYDQQRMKTLWDWLQLLFIPIVLFSGGLWFNGQQYEQNMHIADESQKEKTLKAYMDDISVLLLDKNLSTSQSDSEVSIVAQTKTLVALRVLDPQRRRMLVHFLSDAQLVSNANYVQQNPIIALDGAELSDTDLSGINLSNASMRDTNLKKAILNTTILYHANLTNANLSGAKLEQNNLKGVIMNNTNLSNAYLTSASINGDLSSTNFSGAHLRYADLNTTIIDGTNFTNADLRDTNLSSKQFNTAVLRGATFTGATMPDGSTHFTNTNVSSDGSSFTPFVGTWTAHGGSLVIQENKHATYIARAYKWCETGTPAPCDMITSDTIQPGIHIKMLLDKIVNHVAYGVITTSTVEHKNKSISLQLASNDTILFIENRNTSNTFDSLCGPDAPISFCGA